MKLVEFLGATANVAILAIFYTVIGAFLSYAFYHIFDEFNEEWQKQTRLYQVGDVSIQMIILGIIAFWLTHWMRKAPPIFKVQKQLDLEVDSYVSGMFFVFAMFLFMDSMSSKIKWLYEDLFGVHFGYLFPQEGHLVQLNLSYSRKTDETKHTL